MGHGGQLTNPLILRSRICFNNPPPLSLPKRKYCQMRIFMKQKISSWLKDISLVGTENLECKLKQHLALVPVGIICGMRYPLNTVLVLMFSGSFAF